MLSRCLPRRQCLPPFSRGDASPPLSNTPALTLQAVQNQHRRLGRLRHIIPADDDATRRAERECKAKETKDDNRRQPVIQRPTSRPAPSACWTSPSPLLIPKREWSKGVKGESEKLLPHPPSPIGPPPSTHPPRYRQQLSNTRRPPYRTKSI